MAGVHNGAMPRVKTLAPRIQAAPAARQLRTTEPGAWRQPDSSSAARGYGYAWQRARAQHLRAFPLCAMCAALGVVEVATVVDHVQAHRGDMALFWDRANWQSLCTNCHSSRKQSQEAAALRG